MRKCWYPAIFPFFTMFSTPLRDQSHSLIHILFVLCRRFRLMSSKFYCLVIHISHKTLEIGCAWSKGSGERLQGHHGPLVSSPEHNVLRVSYCDRSISGVRLSMSVPEQLLKKSSPLEPAIRFQ